MLPGFEGAFAAHANLMPHTAQVSKVAQGVLQLPGGFRFAPLGLGYVDPHLIQSVHHIAIALGRDPGAMFAANLHGVSVTCKPARPFGESPNYESIQRDFTKPGIRDMRSGGPWSVIDPGAQCNQQGSKPR